MQVRVNGADRVLDGDPTVRTLLQALGLDRDGIAVAVNGMVVPRSRHPGHLLQKGDQIEVIRAVGGG